MGEDAPMMNFGQLEICFNFIADCIKQHGKKDPIEKINDTHYDFSSYVPSWVVKMGKQEILLREYRNGQRQIHCSDYLNVQIMDGECKFLKTHGVSRIENEKRLIETLMLFNGDITAKDYAVIA